MGIWGDCLFQQKLIWEQVKEIHPKTGGPQLQTQIMANYDKKSVGNALYLSQAR